MVGGWRKTFVENVDIKFDVIAKLKRHKLIM